MKKDFLKVAGKSLKSRLIVGTGKYKSFIETAKSIRDNLIKNGLRLVTLTKMKKFN